MLWANNKSHEFDNTKTIKLTGGTLISKACINLLTAAVHPLPVKITASLSLAFTELLTISLIGK